MGIFKTTALVAALTIGTVGAASATDLGFGGVVGGMTGQAGSTVVDGGLGFSATNGKPGRTTVINRSGAVQESGAAAGLTMNRATSVEVTGPWYRPGVSVTETVGGAVDTATYSRGETFNQTVQRGNGTAFGAGASARLGGASAHGAFGGFGALGW